jgi:glutamate synthase (NADPH/NADH) large chain
VNPGADVSVKLVSEVGVGTVAAGVAKARADHITISGYEGGTGAAPLTSIKHAGSPWEMGLAETQQTLVLNKLRGRVALQADGGIRTGRDVLIAFLLGADEIGFSTAPLIAAGCIMMRKCHLNTCPVGVATQDPVLRKRFKGQPEHVINYMFFVAEEVRECMAALGVASVDELVGRSDFLDQERAIDHWKARGLDLSRVFHRPEIGPQTAIRHVERQHHPIDKVLDHELIAKARAAIDGGAPVMIEAAVGNVDRTVGAMLSGEVAKAHGHAVFRTTRSL